MAQEQITTDLNELVWQFMIEPDPMLTMLEWLCKKMMEVEVNNKVGAEKNEQSSERTGHRSGYRVRRFDTRMGTMYLMIPKVRKGGYIPFFVTEKKRSEAALIQVVREAFVQGVSTRKMERLAKSLGIESLSKGQVSEMTKGLNEQVHEFRTRPLDSTQYPILWLDALYEKVRVDGRVVSMAIQLVIGLNKEGRREVLAIDPMLEESKESYKQMFQKLKLRGMKGPKLVISDANAGLVSAIRESFPGASWQRCKVHFMRNIIVHVTHKEKKAFAEMLKDIWTASSADAARKRADELIEKYQRRFPEAIAVLENGLEDSLAYYAFEKLDFRKISSTYMLERLNREIRRRSKVVGIFPNPDSYLRLITTYLMEYTEDWSVSRAYMNPENVEEFMKEAA